MKSTLRKMAVGAAITLGIAAGGLVGPASAAEIAAASEPCSWSAVTNYTYSYNGNSCSKIQSRIDRYYGGVITKYHGVSLQG
jgi:hypothetical protein